MKKVVLGILGVGTIGGLLFGASYMGWHKNANVPKVEAPIPTSPPTPTPPPVSPLPQPDIKTCSRSFVSGYNDGYSGAWLSPARWVVVSEYRAGWDAGKRDHEAGKPNMFLKK